MRANLDANYCESALYGYICTMYNTDVSYDGFAEEELIECDGCIVIYYKDHG